MNVKYFPGFECKDKRAIGGRWDQYYETYISIEYVRFVGQLTETVSWPNAALF